MTADRKQKMTRAVRSVRRSVVTQVTAVLLFAIAVASVARAVDIDLMEYADDATAQAAYVSDAGSVLTGGNSTNVVATTNTVHTFTANGTFTVPTGVSGNVVVECWGGGGGGGSGTGEGGGGGGGGAYAKGNSVAVTAGGYGIVRGSGGTSGDPASGGGDSSFGGTTVVADGGVGGGGSSSAGGSGGTDVNSTGDVESAGGTGSDGSGSGDVGGGGGGAGGPNGVGANGDTIVDATGADGGDANAGVGTGTGGVGGDAVNGGPGGNDSSNGGGGGGGGDNGKTGGNGGFPGGGGGGGEGAGSSGGAGQVLVTYQTKDFMALESYSEATITNQGTYSLKGVAAMTFSLSNALTRTLGTTVDLTGETQIKFDIRSTRTGSNIKIGIYDPDGTTTEITPNITAADTFQTVTWDISGISDANKNAITNIIITIVNADAANTFYIDNMYSAAVNIAPTSTAPTNSAQAIDGSGYITIGTDVDDFEDDDCKIRIEYSVDGKTTWTNAHLAAASVGVDYGATPSVDNGAASYQVGTTTPIKTDQAGANTVTFSWDTQDAGNGETTITTNYIANVWMRVKANDGAVDGLWYTNASAFAIDNLAPTVVTNVHLEDATPTSGDASFEIDVTWAEHSPDTNMFGYKLNGVGTYTEAAGDANVTNPSPKSFSVTLNGTNYFNAIRCVHTDDFGNIGTEEDTTVVYVCPTSPVAPTVDNPSASTLDVSISTNLTPGLLYAIQCTNGTNFVQNDGSLGVGIYWATVATWGTPKTVTGLSQSTIYGFQVAAGNPNDGSPTTGENSASAFGADASDTTAGSSTAPTIANAAPSSSSPTNATLAGDVVSTGGVPTMVYTYWGLTDGDEVKTNWDFVVTNGQLGEVAFSANVDGLYYGVRYYYRCYATNSIGDDWANATTNFVTDVPGAGVTVDSTYATNITGSSASLLGSLDATNSVFDVTVYWSTSNNTDSTAWGTDDTKSSAPLGWYTNVVGQSLSNDITSLSLSTTYYYTYLGTNACTNLWASGNGSFPTSAGDPPALDATYVGATNIGLTNAWLTGSLTSTGSAPTYVWIYYGDTDQGTNKDDWASTNYLGELDVGEFSTNIISGIDSNTFYYYQIYASNAVDGVWLADSMGLATGPWMLPFNDDFETPAPTRRLGELWGQNGWEVTERGAATIQTNITYGSSTNALKIEGTGTAVTVSHPIDDPAATNIVWMEMYAQAAWADTASPPSDAAGAWYVTTNGKIVVFNGAAQEELTSGPTVPSNTWVRFTTRANYNTKKWSLYCNGTNVAADKTFYNSGNSSCTEIFIQGGTNGATYVDNVYVGLIAPALPPVVSNAAPTVLSSTSATLAGVLSFTGGVPTTVYTYWGDNDGVTTKTSWDHVITNGVLGEGAFSTNVSGLWYGVRYFYSCYATNSAGEDWADSATNFITTKPTWSLANTVATNIGGATASLLGTLDATQSVFNVKVYWSQSNNTDSASWLNDDTAGSVSVGWFTNVSGEALSGAASSLTEATNYYYTFFITNAATNVWASGTNGCFRTLDEVTWPFTETFEDDPSYMANTPGSIDGQHGWGASPANSGNVQSGTVYEGDKAGSIVDGVVSNTFDEATATNVWVDMQVIPAPRSAAGDPSPSTKAAVAFYLNASGYIVALNDTTWVTYTGYTASTSGWVRLTANINYSARTWALYAGTSNNIATAIATNIAFQGSSTNTVGTMLKLTGLDTQQVSYVDSISVTDEATSGKPLNIDNDGDTLPDRWELTYTNTIDGMDDTTDSDGDGLLDWQEWIVGSDPTDADSYLKVETADLVTPAGNDVQFEVMGGDTAPLSDYAGDTISRMVVLVASANDYNGTYTTEATAWDQLDGDLTVTDASAVLEAERKYYYVAVSMLGSTVTNVQRWAMYRQDRNDDYKYLVSVPIDYVGTTNNLGERLGDHMARGLYVGADMSDTNKSILQVLTTNGVGALSWEEYYLISNGADVVWWDGTTNADLSVDGAMGFWVNVPTDGERARTNTVFIGLPHTNTPSYSFVTNSTTNGFAWQIFGWSRAQDLVCSGSGSNQLGLAGLAKGGVTGYERKTDHADLGDQIWVWGQNNRFEEYYWLMDGITNIADRNGRWWCNRTGTYADFRLEPGRAYFYRQHDGSTNFVWSP